MPPILEEYLSILVNLESSFNKFGKIKDDDKQNTKSNQVDGELKDNRESKIYSKFMELSIAGED